MKQLSKTIDDINQLTAMLSSAEICEPSSSALSTLVHIYTAFTDPAWLQAIAQKIELSYPNAQIIGATTCGEIVNGETVLEQTIINFTFFASTQIHAFVMPIVAGEELEIGQQLRRRVDELGDAVPAIMLLTTPLTTNANAVARGLMSSPPSFHIFGGGAGDYALKTNYVMYGSTVYEAAVIVIAFQGADLQVEKTSFLGWSPMSNEMTITQASGTTIHTIDSRPAFEIYQHYFNIPNDAQFFSNALGFPFLINRNGQLMALVPVAVGLNNSLEFISDVFEGEKVSIGFMDTELIQENLTKAIHKMLDFQPESLLLYTCGCRRWALRDSIKSETDAFESIAPTAGFYTVGEFCNQETALPQLNLAFVAVGMREGTGIATRKPIFKPLAISHDTISDIYSSSHLKVIARLSHFSNRLSHELLSAKEQAEQLSKTKLQFLANMSHEIRTPLNAIMSIAFLTQQTDLTTQQQNYLSDINCSAKWLLGILDNILNYSKLETGKIELEQQHFKLDVLISSLKTLTAPLMTDKNVRLIFAVDSTVPSVLIGDSLRLGQVLLNLMSNAIKFTHTGSVTLKVQLLSLDDQQAHLSFSVTDTGIGLDINHRNKLFEAFNQADNSTTRLYGGTGLGLSISKALVSAMGGHISVESQEGIGSCFSFMITLELATTPKVAALPITTLKHDVKYPRLLNARILVVEDNPVIQKLIPAIMGYEGILVDLAKNGLEALALLADNTYAAVLMDCQMPIMDGFEATERIRANPRFDTLPIIAMSGNADEDDQQRCLACGMNDFISKPVDWERAFLTLDQWISHTDAK